MKKIWYLLVLALLARIISLLFLREDPTYFVLYRNFTGRSILVEPALLDLIIPTFVVFFLQPFRSTKDYTSIDKKLLFTGIVESFVFILFPLIAGLGLFVYVEKYFIFFHFNQATILRLVHFVLAFWAVNLFIDNLATQKRWLRFLFALIVTAIFCLSQDLFFSKGSGSGLMGLFVGVGTTEALAILAFRNLYLKSNKIALIAATIVGLLCSFIVVTGISINIFTYALPTVALITGAIFINRKKNYPKWIALVVILIVALFLDFGLPNFTSISRDRYDYPLKNSVKIKDITLKYDNPVVLSVAKRFARVISAANILSQKEFGIHLKADELVIQSIGRGGFRAYFPNKIEGNLISEKYIDFCIDSVQLNSNSISINSMDPVNAILHEYSHLFGTVPYQNWVMGPEEEGWATYSATRLSKLLYQEYGPELWEPPYNYAKIADRITTANLNNHPVFWSHDYEYSGFQLWYGLGKKYGEKKLYRKRWNLTQRKFYSNYMSENIPTAAKKVITEFDKNLFKNFSELKSVKFSDIHSVEDLKPIGSFIGKTEEQINEMYKNMSGRTVDPAIKIPSSKTLFIDLSATFIVLLLGSGLYFKFFNF